MPSVSIQKYVAVKNIIIKSIEDKELNPGQRLPSIREMSERTGYNNSTIMRAYGELEDEGKIYSVDRSGYYVMEIRPKHGRVKYNLDFNTPSPGKDVLPYKDFMSCISKAGELYGEEMFAYGSSEGFEALRKALSKNLMNAQVFVKPDDISITSGSQQALDILSRMEFPNRRGTILVEQPAYVGFMRILYENNLKALGIERDENGFDIEKLENIFSNYQIKFFYTTPRFSNPLGLSYDSGIKKEIARLAKKYDVYIIEDDYLSDIDLCAKNDPIFSYDDSSHVIYIKSFSKTFLPGIRIGLAVLPGMLKERFEKMKWASSLGTSVISQGALEIYLKSGMFEKHIKYLKEYYHSKMKSVNLYLDKYLPEGCFHGHPETGFFNYIKLPHMMNDEDTCAALRTRGILLSYCSGFYLEEFRRRNFLRICISSVPDERIEEGIISICDGIKYEMDHTAVRESNVVI